MHLISLEKNSLLFRSDYSQTRQVWNSSGHRLADESVSPLSHIEQCYYKGRSNASQSIIVAMDTCQGGFKGVIHTHNDSHVIEPMHLHAPTDQLHAHVMSMQDDGSNESVHPYSLHIVYSMQRDRNHEHPDSQGECGVSSSTNAQSAHTIHTASMRTLSSDVSLNLQPSFASMQSDEHIVSSSAVNASQRLRSMSVSRASGSGTWYAEMLVANDHARYMQVGSATEVSANAIVNQMNILYGYTADRLFIPIQVVLIGQITFTHADPWNFTSFDCGPADSQGACVDTLLGLWSEWRRDPSNTAPYAAHDVGQLLSGYNFQGSVLGYAGVAAFCNYAQSSGIVQTLGALGDESFSGVVAAHELGHNFGMQHDDPSVNSCPVSGFIMNAVLTSPQPTNFSTCSVQYFNQYMPTTSCAQNTPTQHWGAAVCGNNFVEQGEDCDCGADDCSTLASGADKCCNGKTCRLFAGSQCSASMPCCDASTCQIITAANKTVCRQKSHPQCDIAETCDGTSAACPADSYAGAGTDCSAAVDAITSGSGASASVLPATTFVAPSKCFGGRCLNLAQQCWTVGSAFTNPPFYSCAAQTRLNNGNLCGTLYCSNNPSNPTQCTFFEYSSTTSLSTQVADGVPCGDSNTQQCLKGSCQDSAELNQQFVWVASAWSYCDDCSVPQTRNVTCQARNPSAGQSSAPVDPAYCTPTARPTTTQVCHNDELICNYGNDGDLQIWKSTRVSKQSMIIGGLSVLVAYIISSLCCFKLLTRPDTSARHVDTRTQLQKTKQKEMPPGFSDAYRQQKLQKKYAVTAQKEES